MKKTAYIYIVAGLIIYLLLVKKKTTTSQPIKPAPRINYPPLPSNNVQIFPFSANKKKLGYPISSGIVTMAYGKHTIPGTKLQTINEGITFETNVGELVRAIYPGEVTAVFNVGGEETVTIKNGDYFVTYTAMGYSTVKKGDKVLMNQIIGNTGMDDKGKGTLQLLINEKRAFVNPDNYLKPR